MTETVAAGTALYRPKLGTGQEPMQPNPGRRVPDTKHTDRIWNIFTATPVLELSYTKSGLIACTLTTGCWDMLAPSQELFNNTVGSGYKRSLSLATLDGASHKALFLHTRAGYLEEKFRLHTQHWTGSTGACTRLFSSKIGLLKIPPDLSTIQFQHSTGTDRWRPLFFN
jgi:hypothetical protein